MDQCGSADYDLRVCSVLFHFVLESKYPVQIRTDALQSLGAQNNDGQHEFGDFKDIQLTGSHFIAFDLLFPHPLVIPPDANSFAMWRAVTAILKFSGVCLMMRPWLALASPLRWKRRTTVCLVMLSIS
jgi:hypothetical protein